MICSSPNTSVCKRQADVLGLNTYEQEIYSILACMAALPAEVASNQLSANLHEPPRRRALLIHQHLLVAKDALLAYANTLQNSQVAGDLNDNNPFQGWIKLLR